MLAPDAVKPSIIIDTDIGGFADDPFAFAIVHRLANHGLVNLLATVGNTRYEGIAMVMSVINTYFGNPHTPLGVTKDLNAHTDPQGTQNWTEYIRSHFPSYIQNNSQVPDAVQVYMKVLEEQPDQSVTILSLGHFTNMANLLRAPAPGPGKLNGSQLVQLKVKHVIAMAGQFPNGTEWNILLDIPSAIEVTSRWPNMITFAGFEVGNIPCTNYYRVEQLTAKVECDPLATAEYFTFKEFNSHIGCYDEVAALMLDPPTRKLYSSVPGRIVITSEGKNTWIGSATGQEYLTLVSLETENSTVARASNIILNQFQKVQ